MPKPWLVAVFGFCVTLYYNSARMSQMEDDVKDFLKRIVWTVSSGFLWLTLTIGIGAYNDLLVPEHSLSIGNIIFYIWMAGTLAALIYMYIRIWKKKFPHG